MRTAFVIALGIVALSGCAHKHTARRVPVPPPPAPTDRSTPAPVNTRTTEAARSAPEGARTPSTTKRSPAPVPAVSPDYVETGKASWYGHPYHGRAAANGEIYDMEKMTAAHRTLPFDTWVRVVNLANEKTVDVRI